jgi:hypothetical protein
LPYAIELVRIERKQVALGDSTGADSVQANGGPVVLDSIDDRGPVGKRSDVVLTADEQLAWMQAKRRVSETTPRCHVSEHGVNAVILARYGVPAGYVPSHVGVKHGSEPGVITAGVEGALGLVQAAEQIGGDHPIDTATAWREAAQWSAHG